MRFVSKLSKIDLPTQNPQLFDLKNSIHQIKSISSVSLFIQNNNYINFKTQIIKTRINKTSNIRTTNFTKHRSVVQITQQKQIDQSQNTRRHIRYTYIKQIKRKTVRFEKNNSFLQRNFLLRPSTKNKIQSSTQKKPVTKTTQNKTNFPKTTRYIFIKHYIFKPTRLPSLSSP